MDGRDLRAHGYFKKLGKKKMKINILPSTYSICRLSPNSQIPNWTHKGSFVSITKTTEELSVVCEESQVPSDVKAESDWRILKVEGPLDFSLTGILSRISTCLAKAKISIFAISTFDTDYIMVKSSSLNEAISSLKKEGYEVG